MTNEDQERVEKLVEPWLDVISTQRVRDCVRNAAVRALVADMAEARERHAKLALKAELPEGYCWGREAMEQFEFGLVRACMAIRAEGPAPEVPARHEEWRGWWAEFSHVVSPLIGLAGLALSQGRTSDAAGYLRRLNDEWDRMAATTPR